MKKKICFLLFAFAGMNQFLIAQNVGIGTTNPVARLHVADSAVVFSATGFVPEVAGNTAIEGEGRRMMWHPGKAAFRAGYVTGDEWDDVNIGRFSFGAGKDVVAQTTGSIAVGLDNRVEGYGGMAIGSNCFSGYNYGVAIGNNAQSKAANGVTIGNAVAVSSINGFAIGNNATVTGNASNFGNGFAIGNAANVTGTNAFAIGNTVTASGSNSTVFGNSSTASGVYAASMGRFCSSSGQSSTSIGYDNQATGNYTVAIGNSSLASGYRSFTFGNVLTASGTSSIAMGNYVSTSNLEGAFALGDNSTTAVMQSFAVNGFRARFAGGYRLFTNSAVTIGAFLNANANSWAALSDVRMKENFLPVDGEAFLQKIAAMPQFTWNYIGQDVATLRHYGPMAQDFYQAFGRDGLGEIGCDTLINQQDFLGVSFIAIQTLEKRTTQLATENTLLKNKLSILEDTNKKLADKLVLLNENIEAVIRSMKEKAANKTVTATHLVE